MFQLKNKLNKADCLNKLAQEKFKRVTFSFYRYVKMRHPKELRDELFREWDALKVFGRIYLAREGINAQMSLPEANLEAFKAKLETYPEFKGITLNFALEQAPSFYKLQISLKKQIVADGLPEDSYDLSQVGNRLSPQEFNWALNQSESVAVDMRNFYESRIGRFEGALCPDSNTFKEELPMVLKSLKGQEDKKVLLYCTGGIRCEKASAYLKHHGFKDVNQLQGGIIFYVQEVRAKGLDCHFKGSNFVFDERISERVTEELLTSCDQCEKACDSYTNCANAACNLLFIQCVSCRKEFAGACSQDCQAIVQLPEPERRALWAKQKRSTYEIYVSRIRPQLKVFKLLRQGGAAPC